MRVRIKSDESLFNTPNIRIIKCDGLRYKVADRGLIMFPTSNIIKHAVFKLGDIYEVVREVHFSNWDYVLGVHDITSSMVEEIIYE